MGDRNLLIAIALTMAALWLFDALALAAPDRGAAVAPFTESWHVAGEGRGTPAATDDDVYFLSKHHELVAIDRHVGRARWTRSTGVSAGFTDGSLVLASRSVIVTGDGDEVMAFDPDGRARWRFTPAGAYGAGLYLGALAEGRVFAGSPSGALYAIDAETGAELWASRIGDRSMTVFAPAVDGDLVVAGFTRFSSPPEGGLAALDAATGRVRWRISLDRPSPDASGAMTGGPLIAGGEIGIAREDGTIQVRDAATGRLRYALPTVGEPAFGSAEPIVHDFRALAHAGDALIAGSLTGTVIAYDLASGRERWRRSPMESSVAFRLASDEATVYVPYLSGQIVALDALSGRERWRIGSGAGGFVWAPLPAFGHLYVAASRAGFFEF
jgi:outer membrane protein assembly factor BamB